MRALTPGYPIDLLTRFQLTALARLLARDLSGAPMEIDRRSLDALNRRGLVEYGGTYGQGPGGTKHQTQALMEETTVVTDAGRALLAEGGDLRAEVYLHLRLERDRATNKACDYESQAKRLRIRATSWQVALNQGGS